jgi:hypothetical protein
LGLLDFGRAKADSLSLPFKLSEGAGGGAMLFMVIERFRNRDAAAVYRRLRESGRMMPEGLEYVDSWVETNYDRCFQLMRCEDPSLFDQ